MLVEIADAFEEVAEPRARSLRDHLLRRSTDDDDAPPLDETSEDYSLLQSAPLAETEMKPMATPKGMPKPYEQPVSTGWFNEQGKCGPTAVANTLLLYWMSVTPQQADATGVHWLIGTMGTRIENYLQRTTRSLVWFNMFDNDSHWVSAVGRTGSGATEQVIVMS